MAPIGVSAKVYDPASSVYQVYDFVRQGQRRYVSTTPVQLSLDAPAGHWWLVVHVETPLNVTGERMFAFQPAPIAYRLLTDTLPAGAMLQVPLAFNEVIAQGDQYAGGRVWQYNGGEIGVWWAPGPTEALLLNNAVVMLEATHDPTAPPEVLDGEEIKWQDRAAFHFRERWPGKSGGPSEAWVIQDKNFWLYVLRVRAVGMETIPSFMQEIAAKFALSGK